MFRKLLVAFTALFLLPVLLVAQDGKLRGKVTDKESGEPLIGANIVIEGTALGASTDINGEYVILSVPPGAFSVKASYIGYAPVTISNVRVSSNLTTSQDFQLSSTAIQVNAVEIIAERPLVQRNTTNTVRLNTQEQIKNIPFRGIQSILALEAGVVQQNGQLYVRGGRQGDAAFYVDGANTTNPLYGDHRRQMVSVIQEALEEIQLQSGGYTAEFGGANAAIIRSQIRAGGSSIKATAQYSTDDFAAPGNKFLGTSSFGFRNAVVTVSGPVPGIDNLRFFVAGAHDYIRNRNQMFLTPFKFENLVTDNLGDHDAGTPLPGPVEFKENSLGKNWDMTNSVQGTVTYDMNPLKFRFSGSYSFNKLPTDNNWPGVLAAYFNQKRSHNQDTEVMFGNLKATHVLSPTTFYEVGVNYQRRAQEFYDPDFKDNWQLYADSAANAAIGYTGFVSHWEGPPRYSAIYQFRFLDPNTPNDRYFKNKQQSIGATIDLTSQINPRWEIKTGGRIESWVIRNFDVQTISNLMTYLYGADGLQTRTFASDYERRIRYIQKGAMQNYGYDIDGNEVDEGFDKPGKPLFASAYIQNKFEYNDLILNVGVRYEYFAPKGVRLPRELYDNPPVDQNLNVIDENALVEQDPFSLLLPRINFSFPVTDKTVFYAQYGKFAQFPSLDNVYHNNIQVSGIVNPATRNPYALNFGNAPAFETVPERSTHYTVGFRQSVSDNFAFDVSGFYKDLKDQLTIRRILNAQNVPVFVGWANEDFGTTKGLELTLELRRTNRLAAKVNYTLSDARGTGSEPLSSRQGVTDDASARPPSFINPFSYNQTHRGTILLDYRFEKGDGGAILEGLGLNGLITFNSGHNYTKIEEIKNLGQASAWNIGSYYLGDSRFRNPAEPVNSSTTPWVFNVDLNLSKTLWFEGFTAEVYLNVLNAFNSKNATNVYPATGTPDDDGWLKTAAAAQYVATPGYTEFYKAINLQNRWAFITRGGNDLYSAPRQIRLGIRLEI